MFQVGRGCKVKMPNFKEGGGVRGRHKASGVTPWYFVGFSPDTVCPVASLRSSTSDQKRKEKTNLTGY